MITYETSIKRLEVEPILDGLTDVITYVYYECVATNNETNVTQTQMGRCNVTNENINHIQYADLTEEEVLKWVNSSDDFLKTKIILKSRLNPNSNIFIPSTTKQIKTIFPWSK